jgi:hypothetical protein
MVAKIKKMISRIKLRVADEMAIRRWEKEKRGEGFPAEWFLDE